MYVFMYVFLYVKSNDYLIELNATQILGVGSQFHNVFFKLNF